MVLYEDDIDWDVVDVGDFLLLGCGGGGMSAAIPSSWADSTIGELSEYIQRGKSPKYADKSTLPVINQKCIRWNLLETQHLKYIHPDQISSWDEPRYIRAGDVLWNSTGTGTVGRAYFVQAKDTSIPKVVDSHVTIVRPNQLMDKRFIFYWIKSPAVQQKIVEMCDGTTNQIELSRSTISTTEIPLAPLPEQKRIADKLDTVLARVDACRDRLNRIPLILKRFKQSVLAAATSGKLTEDLRRDSPKIFTTWERKRATDVCGKVQSGGTPKDGFICDAGIPFLKVYNIVTQHVAFQYKPQYLTETQHQGAMAKSRVKPGDVLMNIVGPPLGKVAVVPDTYDEWNINQAITLFRPSGEITSGWLYAVLCGGENISEILNETKGSVGQVNISLSQCRNFIFPIPSIPEQQEIVRRVETLFAFADRLEARLVSASAAANRLTPALLAKAFRGELVPQDPNDEPASALLQRLAKQKAKDEVKPKRSKKSNSTPA